MRDGEGELYWEIPMVAVRIYTKECTVVFKLNDTGTRNRVIQWLDWLFDQINRNGHEHEKNSLDCIHIGTKCCWHFQSQIKGFFAGNGKRRLYQFNVLQIGIITLASEHLIYALFRCQRHPNADWLSTP